MSGYLKWRTIRRKKEINDQHHIFGRMSGKAILDDGSVLEIKDVMCFAEKVRMKY